MDVSRMTNRSPMLEAEIFGVSFSHQSLIFQADTVLVGPTQHQVSDALTQ